MISNAASVDLGTKLNMWPGHALNSLHYFTGSQEAPGVFQMTKSQISIACHTMVVMHLVISDYVDGFTAYFTIISTVVPGRPWKESDSWFPPPGRLHHSLELSPKIVRVVQDKNDRLVWHIFGHLGELLALPHCCTEMAGKRHQLIFHPLTRL